jgi:hypothetical protein
LWRDPAIRREALTLVVLSAFRSLRFEARTGWPILNLKMTQIASLSFTYQPIFRTSPFEYRRITPVMRVQPL